MSIDIDKLALKAATSIGNIDPDHFIGGRTQAKARIQGIIADAIKRGVADIGQERDELAHDLEAERQHRRAVQDSEQALAAHVEAVADEVGFFPNNVNRRRTSVVTTNIANMKRFSGYLHAIEREFMTMPGQPDPDHPDEPPVDECMVNCWAAGSDEKYVDQFRQALARRDARIKAEALKEADKRLPIGYAAARHVLLDLADEYRRQAKETTQ